MCAAPRGLWPRLPSSLPLRSAAPTAGLVTAVIGGSIGIGGFFEHAERGAFERNAALLRLIAEGRGVEADKLALASYGMSSVATLEFLFFTPLGLLAIYLTISGALRAGSAWLGEPNGDFILTAVDGAAAALFNRNKAERQRIARTKREGPQTPDRLLAGKSAGIEADYVLLSARRKPEWQSGAIVMTSSDWYRLGVPFDVETPSGLRTAYPLSKLQSVEVVRRGIEYELPRLSRAKIDMKKIPLAAAALALSLPAAMLDAQAPGAAGKPTPISVVRDVGCGCCVNWAEHLRKSGFDGIVRESNQRFTETRGRKDAYQAIAFDKAGKTGVWSSYR